MCTYLINATVTYLVKNESYSRLIKLSTRRKVSVDLERSNETFGCRNKVENLRVDPSSSFDLDSLGGDKLF